MRRTLIAVEELTLVGVLPVPDSLHLLASGSPVAEPDQLLGPGTVPGKLVANSSASKETFKV